MNKSYCYFFLGLSQKTMIFFTLIWKYFIKQRFVVKYKKITKKIQTMYKKNIIFYIN